MVAIGEISMIESVREVTNFHVSPDCRRSVGEGQRLEKMQGHWVLAKAGKRVLRPGGLTLTRRMLAALAIGSADRVIEFAPGLGVTARMVLRKRPSAYWGVERDPAAAEHLERQLGGSIVQIVHAPAEASCLATACATVVYGEALLSMQASEQKLRIFAEARRLLSPGGRYGVHELCFTPDASDGMRREIQSELSKAIHVGVQPLSRTEWVDLFEQNGMKVIWSATAPMHLLEPRRLVQDEGLWGVLRIAFNMAKKPVLRQRIIAMRRFFRRYQAYLCAISLVGQIDGCERLDMSQQIASPDPKL
jgi:phospholipid N-methyltransferase